MIPFSWLAWALCCLISFFQISEAVAREYIPFDRQKFNIALGAGFAVAPLDGLGEFGSIGLYSIGPSIPQVNINYFINKNWYLWYNLNVQMANYSMRGNGEFYDAAIGGKVGNLGDVDNQLIFGRNIGCDHERYCFSFIFGFDLVFADHAKSPQQNGLLGIPSERHGAFVANSAFGVNFNYYLTKNTGFSAALYGGLGVGLIYRHSDSILLPTWLTGAFFSYYHRVRGEWYLFANLDINSIIFIDTPYVKSSDLAVNQVEMLSISPALGLMFAF